MSKINAAIRAYVALAACEANIAAMSERFEWDGAQQARAMRRVDAARQRYNEAVEEMVQEGESVIEVHLAFGRRLATALEAAERRRYVNAERRLRRIIES